MTAIPAATVILMRDGPGGPPELLMVERGAGLAFAGGALVFPGGRVDPADLGVARDPALATGGDGLDDADAAARVACCREAFEEAGVLLTDGAAPPTQLAAWRNRLASVGDSAEAPTFAQMLVALGLKVDLGRFVPFAQWEPPAAAAIRRRFDTRFYLADAAHAAAADVSPDGEEAVALLWTTAAAVLARAKAGDAALVFPTRCNLERLAQYTATSALLAASAARGSPFIQPEIVDRDGVMWLTIPTDCDYPFTEERLDAVRRE